MNKRIFNSDGLSELELAFSNIDVSENNEYTLLKESLSAKYKDDESINKLLSDTRKRYIRYIKYVNFEENWRLEKEMFEFLRLDITKNKRIAFDLMKYIDNMIMDIIDSNKN
jgi:hypothetical protein